MRATRWLLFHPIRTLSLVVALAGGLTLAGALAADQGPRHHAEGRYEAATARYVVAAGDDLAAIAERFGVPVAELKSQNKLASDTIEAGQKLTIPGGSVSPKYKMTTPIAPGVATPDTLETSIGALRLRDGVPEPETVEKIY
ncbi:MAG: LysM peptidoglycan-binding domain-containing protein, partial [Candidatus Contendobacter sp.]|nr:LysM peptidoglycan-binding domain-containing protein [Candidatus Contendobacter sp.]